MKMKKNLSLAIAATLALSSGAQAATMSGANPLEVGKGASNYINSNGELMLYGVIGDWWEGNDALSIVTQLENATPTGDLHVRIHSEGGNILEGLAIYNALKMSSRRVVVTIDGMALSIATVIALAGDEIRMPRNAFQFFHMAQNEVRGEAKDLREAADTLEQFSSQAASIYAEHSNLSQEEAMDLMANNTWLNAEQCLEHGLVHTILDPVEAVAHHMEFGEKELPQGVFALMQLPITAAPAALDDNEEEETPVKTAQMNAGPNAGKPTPKDNQDPQGNGPADAELLAQGAALERTRQAELRSIASQHGIADSVMQAWIKDEVTVADARTAALAELAKRDTENMPSGRSAVVVTGASTMQADITAALLHRVSPGLNTIEQGNQFAHMSLMDVSRQMLTMQGENIAGKSPNQIAGMVLQSTSDLPAIFADVANNEMARGYAARMRTFTQFARRVQMNNFKAKNITRISDAPVLLDKQENGEYVLGHLEDSKETLTLQTKGRIIRISREMIVNDDMDALSRLPAMMGAQAALNEIRVVYGLLKANAKMGEDGVTCFHVNHNNLITGAGSPDIDTLGAMRTKLRTQKSKAAKGETGYALNTPLKYLIVPASLETKADQVTADVTPGVIAAANQAFKDIEVIVEAELDADSTKAFYGLGDPALVDGIVYGYLEGEEGAYIDTAIDFKSDAIDMKVRHDFAASLVDFRGLVKHAGE